VNSKSLPGYTDTPVIFKSITTLIGGGLNMELREFTVNGFQSFGMPQSVELKPLNFFFGPNSSGKSSIGRAIRFLSQSSMARGSFVYAGDAVDLSSAKAAVHGQEISGAISLGLGLQGPSRPLGRLDKALLQSLEARWTIEARTPDIPTNAHFKFRFQLDSHNPSPGVVDGILEFETNRYGEVLLTKCSAEGDLSVLESFRNPVESDDSTEENPSTTDRFGFSRSPLVPQSVGLGGKFDFGEGLSVHANGLLNQLRGPIDALLASISYCGPIREISAHFVESNKVFEPIKADGSNIQEILGSIPDKEFARLSSWLERLTNGVYSLERVPVTAEIPQFESQIQTFLRDKFSGALVAFKDAGAGISQLLPILVHVYGRINTGRTLRQGSSSYSRGNLGRFPGLVLIEQPELHLHPRMQAEMANFLIEIAYEGRDSTEKPQILCETHSEQMLLRVQKHVATGRLSGDDVGIYFVDRFPGSKSSYVQRIRMRDDGSFRDAWPVSFSEIRLNEFLD
jgi:hypothetical protein